MIIEPPNSNLNAMSGVRQRKKSSKKYQRSEIIHNENESSNERVNAVNLRNIMGKL